MAFSDVVNRVKFVSEDFDTYRAEADQFFQDNYPQEFNNLIATDIGNALMDQLAFAMQALTFTINRRASELFLSTARLTSSITKLARMLGYTIAPAVPATTTLNITLTGGPYTFPVKLPPQFTFQGPGDTIYEYHGVTDFIIPPGNTTGSIPIKEGQTKTISFISDGSANQQFSVFGILTGQFLYSDEMVLTIDGIEWTRQDLIKFVTENVYEVLFTDAPPKLKFGDGIAGNIPPTGAQIRFQYRFGKGASGAIGQNQIASSVTPLIINGITIPMSYKNSVSNVGSDPEDIRHVRAFASTFFRTQNAAVVKEDYDQIAALRPGVALADAQIMRGIKNDITIQSALSGISYGEALILSALSGIAATSITGTEFLGVDGVSGLFVGGTSGLGVSGLSILGISGTEFLGSDVSGNVTGVSYLGISGQGSLGVGGVSGLFVGGTDSLGVSGISFLGFASFDPLIQTGLSGVAQIHSSVSGLAVYLSQVFSDTSKSNNVQVVVLSTDSNNRYISPNLTTLEDVESTLQSLADAVVTVNAVDGISKVVNANITLTIGINQNAVKTDVEQISLNALTSSITPFGLLVKRTAGQSLYVSDIENAVQSANTAGDIRYINVVIDGPIQYLDENGNLIIGVQQIIQNGTVSVKVIQRFLTGGQVVTA